jgi:hypothetical protein
MRVLPQGPSVAEYLCDAAYRFFETTPQDLVHLYKKLAIEFYPSPYRAISLALLCKELGAKRQRSTAEKAIEFATTATTSVVHVSTDTAVKVVKVAQDAVELVYVAATDAAGKLAHDAVEAYEAAADLTARAPAATAGALEQLTRKRSSNSSAGTGGITDSSLDQPRAQPSPEPEVQASTQKSPAQGDRPDGPRSAAIRWLNTESERVQ